MKVVYRRWSDGSIGVAFSYDEVPRGADVLSVDRVRADRPSPARRLRALSDEFFALSRQEPRRSADLEPVTARSAGDAHVPHDVAQRSGAASPSKPG